MTSTRRASVAMTACCCLTLWLLLVGEPSARLSKAGLLTALPQCRGLMFNDMCLSQNGPICEGDRLRALTAYFCLANTSLCQFTYIGNSSPIATNVITSAVMIVELRICRALWVSRTAKVRALQTWSFNEVLSRTCRSKKG